LEHNPSNLLHSETTTDSEFCILAQCGASCEMQKTHQRFVPWTFPRTSEQLFKDKVPTHPAKLKNESKEQELTKNAVQKARKKMEHARLTTILVGFDLSIFFGLGIDIFGRLRSLAR